jgi:5-methylcytosine-specific restriction endonuclease McrA
MNRKLYPKNWREISNRIRFERAAGKCEECGIPHGALRDRESSMFVTAEEVQQLDSELIPFDVGEAVMIILTTAHLGIAKPDGSPGDRSDTMDCRPENLKALCQRCHLGFDRSDNINRRRINRRKKLVRAGQLEMF